MGLLPLKDKAERSEPLYGQWWLFALGSGPSGRSHLTLKRGKRSAVEGDSLLWGRLDRSSEVMGAELPVYGLRLKKQ